MSTPLVHRIGRLSRLRARPRHSSTVWVAFAALHLVFLLALLPTIARGGVLGDLPLYRAWAESGLVHHLWPGIDSAWVYPIGALAPITLAGVAGPVLYQLCWFLMTTSLNGLAVGVLIRQGRSSTGPAAAWVWLILTLILSPVGMLRLEGITAPLVVVALALLAHRPAVAAALLAAATWIKVWPAAVLLAVVIASRDRARVVGSCAAVTAGIVALVIVSGGAPFLAGFVAMQSNRALQLEAPVTTPWVWLSALHLFRTIIIQDPALETREVQGPGAGLAAALMTPIMVLAVTVIAVLIFQALRRGAEAADLLLVGALALVSAFIVFNKVGSPQYVLWIVPIVTVGVANGWRRWRAPTYLLGAIAGLTTLVFPTFYRQLLDGNVIAVSFLTARNALLVVLLIWSVVQVVRTGRRDSTPRRGDLRRRPYSAVGS